MFKFLSLAFKAIQPLPPEHILLPCMVPSFQYNKF